MEELIKQLAEAKTPVIVYKDGKTAPATADSLRTPDANIHLLVEVKDGAPVD